MKILIKLFAFTLLLNSCSGQKTISEKTIQEYQQKGYTLGTLASKKASDCTWVITVNGSKEQYDPINIDDKKFADLKTKKSGFFFKFQRLRMKNRCDNILPIKLLEITEAE